MLSLFRACPAAGARRFLRHLPEESSNSQWNVHLVAGSGRPLERCPSRSTLWRLAVAGCLHWWAPVEGWAADQLRLGCQNPEKSRRTDGCDPGLGADKRMCWTEGLRKPPKADWWPAERGHQRLVGGRGCLHRCSTRCPEGGPRSHWEAMLLPGSLIGRSHHLHAKPVSYNSHED